MSKTNKNKKSSSDNTYFVNWYAKNKERHLNYMKQKVECDCGSVTSMNNIERHYKTKKHQEWAKQYPNLKKCKCGGFICKEIKKDHKKTSRHKHFIEKVSKC